MAKQQDSDDTGISNQQCITVSVSMVISIFTKLCDVKHDNSHTQVTAANMQCYFF